MSKTPEQKLREARKYCRSFNRQLQDANTVIAQQHKLRRMLSALLGFPGVCWDDEGLRDRVRDLQAENRLMARLLKPANSVTSKTQDFGIPF